MTYVIFKTSDWYADDAPCKNAVKVDGFKDNYGSFHHPHYLDGTIWTIEMNTLQDITDLMEEVKYPLIFTRYDNELSPNFNTTLAIEIYDTYRE